MPQRQTLKLNNDIFTVILLEGTKSLSFFIPEAKFRQSEECVCILSYCKIRAASAENPASLGQKRCRFIGLAKGTGVLSGDVPVN